MAITAFSNFTIAVSETGTVPALDYSTGKIYVDIGSGTIARVYWDTPVASGNAVASYTIHILYYDKSVAAYKSLYSKNIGNVNEFYLTSDIIQTIQPSFVQLQVYVEANSIHGMAYNCTSNIQTLRIGKGSGCYINVVTNGEQKNFKRALGFAKLDFVPLINSATGEQVLDAEGRPITCIVSSVQDPDTGWTLMQEFYTRDAANQSEWKLSDMQYEALTDTANESIMDINDETIYIT